MSQKEFELVEAECLPMTVELAEKIRDMEASPTEREMDPKRVKHLRQKAMDGTLVTFHWAVAEYGGKTIRMNGQHSSSMLCELNGSFPSKLYAHIDRYTVKSEKGLALLFRQFDDRKSSRGPADIAGAYQGLFSDIRDLPRKTAKLGIEGIHWRLQKIDGEPVPTGDEMWEMFEQKRFYPFLHWLCDVLTSKTREMQRREVVAAMYASYLADETKARLFWSLVASGGVELADDHPAHTLDMWLLEQREIKNQELKAKSAAFYQASIMAFNAFSDERPLKSINIKKAKGWLEPHAG